MKVTVFNNKITGFVLSLAVGLVLVGSAFSLTATAGEETYGAENVTPQKSYTIEEMLNYALEDEYKARAEYELIIKKMDGDRPFTNILKAEETHIALLKPLFEEYGVQLPEDEAAAHTVLFESIDQALETGVQAKIDNIAMYKQFLAQDLPADLENAFTRLKSASESHLEAFQQALSGGGRDWSKKSNTANGQASVEDRGNGNWNENPSVNQFGRDRNNGQKTQACSGRNYEPEDSLRGKDTSKGNCDDEGPHGNFSQQEGSQEKSERGRR